MAEVMHVIGHIGEYDAQAESITTYLERLSLYMDANSISNDLKVAVLLTVIGAKTYSILKSLTSPELPKSKTLDQLKTALESHFNPKPLVIAERFRFYQLNQLDNETIAEFAAHIRRLSIRCEFKDFSRRLYEICLFVAFGTIPYIKITHRGQPHDRQSTRNCAGDGNS